MGKLEKIKSSISIAYLWRLNNLPGTPGKTCHCPWRKDDKPSFSVYVGKEGHDRFYDHATGMKGDCIDFYAMCHDIMVPAAIEKLLLLTGEAEQTKPTFNATAKAVYKPPTGLREPTDEEVFTLALLRGLDAAAFDLARRLGTLVVGMHPRSREEMWFITDQSGHGSEGRRFNGYPCRASNKKSAALPGTDKSWPYGLLTHNEALNACQNIMLCEGGPDYYAAIALAVLADFTPPFLPVTMLGANCSIGEEAGKLFKDKRVVIVPHNDQEGEKGTEKWVDQLSEFGARVFVHQLPCEKDLNDFLVSPGSEDPLDLLKGFKCE